MHTAAQLGQQYGRYVMELTAQLLQPETPTSLSHMERDIRTMLLKQGRFLLGAWLTMLDQPYPAQSIPCRCGAEGLYQFRREATLLTVLGQVTYQRAYYLCPVCHRGTYPLDEALGLRPGQMSAQLESLSAMTGAQLPFGQGSQLFASLTLVPLSDHSLAKATQAVGAEVAALEQEWMERSRDEQWLQTQGRLSHGPERLYGSLDGVKVHIRGDQEHPWRELKAGAWFTTTQEAPRSPDEDWQIQATDITYYCDLCQARQFGELVWATGCQRGAQLAQELIFLGDGAEWIWNLVREHYPEAIQIVDWFHATEYIAPVAQAAFTDEAQQTAWVQRVRNGLWQGDLDRVIRAFQEYRDHPRAGEAAGRAITYVTNNRHRMDYPTYRARGYQIGSGTIESGCKRIATQRLKVAGAIWNEANAIKTAKARSALLSGQWEIITARREHLSTPLAA